MIRHIKPTRLFEKRTRLFEKRTRLFEKRTRSFAVHILCFLLLGSVAPACRNKPTPRDAPKKPKPRPASNEVSADEEEVLTALGYFDRAEAQHPEKRNVTKEAETAFEGYNLYNSRHRAEAYLVDMSGKVVHTWRGKNQRPPWMHMELQPNGDLLVICKSSYIARYNWHSKRIFQKSTRAHHDLAVDNTGTIHLLSHKIRPHAFEGTDIPIVDDQIIQLSPKGRVLRKTHLYRVIKDLIPINRLMRIRYLTMKGKSPTTLALEGAPSDVSHTNSIQILPKDIEGIAPKNSYLVSMRELNRTAIISEDGKQLLWSFGNGIFEGQHHATLLDNGHILVFDNGIHRKKSRIVEFDPKTERIVWQYEAPDFFSRLRGAAQPLPNGNILITESDKGHVFEITRDGNVVWEFWNPDVQGETSMTRAVIYRMTRYPLSYLDPGLL